MGDWVKQTLWGAVTVAVAYIAHAYTTVPLEEPWRTIVALLAVALWNRIAGYRAAQ
jgi:hypothetical protein